MNAILAGKSDRSTTSPPRKVSPSAMSAVWHRWPSSRRASSRRSPTNACTRPETNRSARQIEPVSANRDLKISDIGKTRPETGRGIGRGGGRIRMSARLRDAAPRPNARKIRAFLQRPRWTRNCETAWLGREDSNLRMAKSKSPLDCVNVGKKTINGKKSCQRGKDCEKAVKGDPGRSSEDAILLKRLVDRPHDRGPACAARRGVADRLPRCEPRGAIAQTRGIVPLSTAHGINCGDEACNEQPRCNSQGAVNGGAKAGQQGGVKPGHFEAWA